MFRRKRRVTTVRVLLVICVAAFLVWWIKYRPVDELSDLEKTADWQTYINHDFGFSLRVPNEWKIEANEEYLDIVLDGSSVQLYLEILANPNDMTTENWATVLFDDDFESKSLGKHVFVIHENQYAFDLGHSILVTRISDQPESMLALGSLQLIPRSKRLVSLSDAYLQKVWQASPLFNVIESDRAVWAASDEVQKYIRKLAVERGYRDRFSVFARDMLASIEGYPLQKSAASAWQRLAIDASQAGFGLFLTSGYRDVADQASIFTSDFNAAAISAQGSIFTDEQILSAQADAALDEVMKAVAPPGMSKHHGGYTIDITQIGFNTFDFGSSEAYAWLAANDFMAAKNAGFVPSYPANLDKQGPEPEAWEYNWLGEKFLNSQP